MKTRNKTIIVVGTVFGLAMISFLLFNIFYLSYPDSKIKNISDIEWKQKILDNKLATTFKEMYPEYTSANSQQYGFFSYTATNGYDKASLSLEISEDGSVTAKYICKISDVTGSIVLSKEITPDKLKENQCFR